MFLYIMDRKQKLAGVDTGCRNAVWYSDNACTFSIGKSLGSSPGWDHCVVALDKLLAPGCLSHQAV